ncbi:BTAD domain-containing putative transcriptional regulator [Kribbella sp. NPDC026611]|uniref:AfsR/SARP family transcriptional regulator n=1 Tax=Kribbella sp. NPDC026611 TaxID=3154911 RepID=UPI003411B0BB
MQFRLLGPLEVRHAGAVVPIGAARQRAVLAMLLLRAGRVVTADEFVDAVWERPPRSARSNLRTYLASLRRALRAGGQDRLRGGSDGYSVTVLDGELDLIVFDRLVEQAAAATLAGDLARASECYRQAQDLWRGDPLSGLAIGPVLRAELARIDERRQDMVERAIDCRLDLGQHQDLVAEIRARVADYPYREGLRRQLMLALHRCGRRAEALAAYQDIRRLLVTELGVEPGVELRQLQAVVLQDQEPTAPVEGSGRTPTGLVGRTVELNRLDELSRSTGLITISGPAGVGKTALARHWAQQVATKYPDGLIFLDLRGFHGDEPLAPTEAVTVLLRSIGASEERIPPDPAAQLQLWRTLATEKRVLVLLDDARSAEQVRPLLPNGSGSLLVATSRERLAGLVAIDRARPVVLEPLDPGCAVALLAEVLDDHRVSMEPVAAAAIAELCAGLPLAVRIVAARLVTEPNQSIAAEVARLEAAGGLSGLRVPGDPSAAVRTAFDQSYRLLDASAQRMFRLAGSLPGADFSVPVVAALTAVSTSDAQVQLDALCSASLLDRWSPERFRFHDLLRQYAAEQSAAGDPDHERREAHRRALGWYLHGAETAGRMIDPHRRRSFTLGRPDPLLPLPRHRDRAAALSWCETERINLVAAIALAAEQGLHDLGWQLPVAMFGFFELRRYWSDWITTHQIGLTCARAAGLVAVESWMLNSLGIALKQTGKLEAAFEYYGAALRIRQSIGDRQGEAATLNNLGTASNRLDRLAAAEDYYRRALKVFREVGDRWGEALALTNLGEAHRRQERFTDALACYREASAIRRAQGDLRGVGYVLHNLGTTFRELGRMPQAIEHLRSALEVRQQTGDRWGTARTLSELGQIYSAVGIAEQAGDCLHRALVIFDELGDPQAEQVRRHLTSTVPAPDSG